MKGFVMGYIPIAKKAVSFIVGAGVKTIITTIIKDNVEPDNLAQKVTVVAGTLVVAGIVADASSKYTDAKIDACVNFYNEKIKPKLNQQ
jgi:hypothetical protein